LVKKLDEEVAKNTGAKMGSFVVVLTDDDKSEDKLKDLAEKEKIKKVVLCTDNPSGPEKWKIAKEADVTVLLYVKSTVKKNFAFEKGKMTDKDITAIVDAVKEILPEKKDK
jgi:hypothetical protein